MRDRWTFGTGLFFLAFAALTLLVWIPRDIETGVVEVFRRSRTIGDSMAPVVAAVGIALSSIALIAGVYFSRAPEDGAGAKEPHAAPHISAENLRYVALLFALLAASLAAMYWAGPLLAKLVSFATGGSLSYRELKGTVPWKYAGYLTGGTLLCAGLIAYIEQRLNWRIAIIAFAVALVLAIAYDLPFDSLLLPPNGDY
ncbi:MAG: hypothetical protein AB7F96_01320 [Beijerinckiaceae bacterium]